ncbi:hypothetical protein PS001_24665, partial [Shigella sonnei]|nr:hypothetical protein [Shigella sonnei]
IDDVSPTEAVKVLYNNQGTFWNSPRRMFENVMSGAIPEGSLIVVENFDRFSRADIDTAIDDVSPTEAGKVLYNNQGTFWNSPR